MSFRYASGIVKPGFNSLAAPTVAGYLYNLTSWGHNNYGQLGTGNTTSYSSPVQVGSLTNWLTLAASGYASFGIKTDGTLWSWGNGTNGVLGLGNTTNYSSPKQIGALTNWLQISSGAYYGTCSAIKTDGTLWSWGRNESGQLGQGDIISRSSPTQIGSLTTWYYVSVSQDHVLAIKTDGTLWSWGNNQYGQLGLGNITKYSSPKQVGSLTSWLRLTGGVYQGGTGLAIKTDGTLWSWGLNNTGQLGLGNVTFYSSPKQVGSLTNWSKITGGGRSTLAIKTDGTLWSWGNNSQGQIGLGNRTNYSSPKQVGALTSWSSVNVPYQFCVATKTDGTLWAWGQNNNGQLGLGNVTSYSSPKQVGSLTNWTTAPVGGLYNTLALLY